jgi:hypothetical protein
MPITLEITLIVALAAVAATLVPLLLQLRRTAKGMEAFLASSGRDLAQIAEDVRASRVRMDVLSVSLQASLDELSSFARVAGELGRTVKEFHSRLHGTIEATTRNIGMILGGISAVLAFLKNRQTHPEPQPEQPL